MDIKEEGAKICTYGSSWAQPKSKTFVWLFRVVFPQIFLSYPSALRLHCRMQHVASSWGLLLSGYCSLTPLLQVIIRALKRSMPPLCSPFTPEWDPLQIKHWLSSQQDLCCRHIVYQKQPQPQPLQALLRRAHSSGEWCCIEASCAKLPPPSQVKGIEEQLGRLLFWHSLYVLLIGANWHRGAPLFRCIIWPASVRRKEKAQTKGRGKIGQGLNQSTAISLLHQNSQANFVLGFVVAAYWVCWLKSAISKIWL